MTQAAVEHSLIGELCTANLYPIIICTPHLWSCFPQQARQAHFQGARLSLHTEGPVMNDASPVNRNTQSPRAKKDRGRWGCYPLRLVEPCWLQGTSKSVWLSLKNEAILGLCNLLFQISFSHTAHGLVKKNLG